MLLVLMVLMILVGIGIPGFKGVETAKEEKRFFDLLLQDIYYAQSESYRSQTSTLVVFYAERQSYDIAKNIHTKIASREMPKTVTFKKSSNISQVYFSGTGSILSSGTLRFGTSTGEKTIVVHLGKGRVVMSE
jgi:Tfp pilus assembly protein FimT